MVSIRKVLNIINFSVVLVILVFSCIITCLSKLFSLRGEKDFLKDGVIFKRQLSNELVCVSGWPTDPDYDGIFPKGSREKMALYCPPVSPFSFLIPNHRYIFKESVRRHPHQFWMEIAAYRIGAVMGVTVPPAFVAYDHVNSKEGALIEWFYSYPGTPEHYIDGGNFMTRLIPKYDIEKGSKHNFRNITVLMRSLHEKGFLSDSWVEHWAKVFTFDAIIGNTDRHHDNWGLVFDISNRPVVKVSLSPAFDNGTSLGYEILDENIVNFTEEKLKQYISRGTHHMKWTIDDDRSQHFDLVVKYIEKYPPIKEIVLNCLDFDYNELTTLIWELTEFNVSVPLLPIRAEFMLRLINYRRKLLLEVLDM